jgi:hypothetical protein
MECISKQPMPMIFVQHTNCHIMRKIIHNYLKEVICQRLWPLTNNSHNSFSNVTKNNIFQNCVIFLKHNSFTSKLVKHHHKIKCWYCHLPKQRKKSLKINWSLNNLVFIGVFNFLGYRPQLTQALVPFLLPFLDFLGQVM